ncbi:hypothetical protein [Streptomyces sp. HD]|uniref:hypothetical protein n=1 Tax=Streptomyces sp. HD TaxID=3020892 RepID=UPI002330CFC6|nr:hypothetical protein [Streptomyces sp. HD]MDC0773299.1 hypothetical protein [Streptomyces sp. HD]
MDEGWAAITAGAVSLLGASVGGLAAIIGARIGAEKNATSVLDQTIQQAHAERRQWIRDQRALAYEQFLTAWDEYTLARGRFHFERPPTYDNFRLVQESGGRLHTAAFRIRVVSPESVTTLAEEVLGNLTAMAMPDEVRSHWDVALSRFRQTDDPELQQNLIRIAEEILYRGSWDGAIDVAPQRHRFLQTAAEALEASWHADIQCAPRGRGRTVPR